MYPSIPISPKCLVQTGDIGVCGIVGPPLTHPDVEYLCLSLEGTGESALGQVVLDSSLLSGSGLSEGNGSTEGTGQCGVLETGNADVAGAANLALAGHASGHLDGNGEVGDGSSRQTANANAGNILGDFSILEGSGVGTAGGGIDGSGKRTSTVLVDLVEDHLDGTIIGSGGHTSGGSASGGLDGSLLSTLGGLGTTAGGTGQESAAGKSGLVDGTSSLDLGGVGRGTVHEDSHHLSGVDGTATVGATESRGLVGAELLAADDGGIGLRAASGRGAITRSAISDGQTRQVDTVGTLDLSDDTVGEDVGGSKSRNEDSAGVLHFECGVCVGGGDIKISEELEKVED